MKYAIAILLMLASVVAKAQLPSSTFPSRIFNGNTKAQWIILDSPVVNPILDTFNARYPGTQLVRIQGGDTAFWFGAGGHLWFRPLLNRDTISLSNRINLKLNITDTTNKWWGIGKRWVDTIYRVNDSTIGYTINNGAQQTFQILGRLPSGGGSGSVTSVALSMPSAFSVSGSPITSSGTLSVSGAGTTAQYIRGNGTLATFDTGAIPNFYLKVRGLLSGTSPITFNQTTGIIGINNANTSGTKGAATFSAAFQDNGSGTIDLLTLGAAGSCTGCLLNIDAKGRITAYSDGPGGATNNVNIGAGFRWLNGITQELRTVANSPTITWDSVSTANTLTPKADTSILATKYDLTQTANISNTSLTANGDYTQNWNNKQLYVDSIAGSLLLRGGGVGSTGTRRKEFRLNWGGSSFGNNLDGFNMLASVKKGDNSGDSLTMGLMSSGTGVLSMGTFNLTNSTNNTFISYNATNGLINISAKDSIWIKGATPAATADSILGIRFVSGSGISRIFKIPLSAAGGGGATLNNIGTGFAWAATPGGDIKRAANSNTILWDSTSISNSLTAKVDTSIIGTKFNLTQINWNRSLLNGNVDTATTAQFGYAQVGFVQSEQDTPTDSIWEGEPFLLYPYRSSDTAIYNPRLLRLFKTKTHRYDITQPPNVITAVAMFGSEGVGNPYMRIGGIEENWYDNYEYHPIEMKPISFSSAIRMQSVTMNRTTGISTWTQRATQHVFSDISDNQMFNLTRSQSTLLASGVSQPTLRFLTQSTDGSNGGFTMATESHQTLYNWHPSGGSFDVNIWDMPYQWVIGTSRGINSSDAEYDFRFSNRLANNRMWTIKNGSEYLAVLEKDGDSISTWTFGGNHTLAAGGYTMNVKSLRNKKQKQFAITISTNAADTAVYKAPFLTDTLGRIAINIPNPNATWMDGLLGLTDNQQLRVYGTTLLDSTTYIKDVTAPVSTYNILVHGLTDSIIYQVPVTTFATGNTLYTGDGALPADRNIASGGFTLRLSGANNSDTLMSIVNTGTSSTGLFSLGSLYGVDAQSTTIGLRAFGSSTGMTAEGGTNEGAIIKSDAIRGATIQSVPATTNTVQEVVRLERGSTGGPGGNGIGGSADFYNKLSDNSSNVSNQMISKWTNATVGSRVSQFSITGVNATVTGTILTIDGDGAITTAGRRIIATTTSSAGTLTLSNSEAYIFNGTTTTWTLPAVSGTTGTIYYIKNAASGSITLNAAAAANEIYSTSAVNTYEITAGSAIILISNGTYFLIN